MQIPIHLLLAFIACAATSARAAEAPEQLFTLTIVRGALPAAHRLLKVEKGDALRLHIISDAPGALHLHGYRLAAQLVADQPAELAFKAYATGRYSLEWHGDDKTANAGAHRGPPLAILEVRPK